MLKISGIKNGIVIDHITTGLGIKIFKYLKLDESEYNVALLMNVPSKKMGKKDIIKIEDVSSINFDALCLIDPDITINIIKNEHVLEKKKMKLPQKVENIIRCKNPRCITSIEQNIPHVFYLTDEDNHEYRCTYCDELSTF